MNSLVPAAAQWAVSRHSPHTLPSAGCSRREGSAESQALEGPSGITAHSDLWKLLGPELQPGADLPGVRAAPALASSIRGPAWRGFSTKQFLTHQTLALGCGEQPPVCYSLIYFSWLFHFLGRSKWLIFIFLSTPHQFLFHKYFPSVLRKIQ